MGRTTHVAHAADWVVQETFARVLARPRALRRTHELPYLLRALRNTYLTGLRTTSRRVRTVELPVDESAAMRSTRALPDVSYEHRALFAAIAALPDELREALVAVDVVGLSYREAGRALGARESTITTRLFRARRGVARLLDGERARNEPRSGRG
jgi:RNA polymerase sigma-70 factor (ECF subfamily)